MMDLADLTPEQVEIVRALEARLPGVYVLAFANTDESQALSAGVPLAELSAEQVRLVADAERRMGGVVLLAFRGA